MIAKALTLPLTVAALLLAATAPAHAYLDPGTGSIILQALIGGAVAGMVFWRRSWEQLKTLFRRKPK